MKLDIKFRGKRVDNGEWIYGNYFHNFRKGESHNIIDFKTNEWAVIIPETVGQYLNLTDSKGNEIYHGDLLDFNEQEWGGKFEPEPIYMEDIIGDWRLAGSLSDLKEWRTVVGNIYENEK